MLLRQRLVVEDVERRAGERSVVERSEQRVGVEHRPAGGVHEVGPGAHGAQLGCADVVP
jgi:hypothetical protein